MTCETVNHPTHYNQHPSGVECITIIEHFSHNVGAAVKYLWRAGLKPGASEIDDLRKAAWYIQREITRRLVASSVTNVLPAEEPAAHSPVYDIHEQFLKRSAPAAYPPEVCIPNAPDWANWYAEDASGGAWFYSHRPQVVAASWVADGKLLAQRSLHISSDWRQSIRRIVRSEAAR